MNVARMTWTLNERYPKLKKAIPLPVRSLLFRKMQLAGEEARGLSDRLGTSDLSDDVVKVIDQVWEYTITSRERIAALCSAVDDVTRHDVPGAIVECGLWKGGSLLAAILRLQQLGVQDRPVFGYDTFTGMNKPTEVDVDYTGQSFHEDWEDMGETPTLPARAPDRIAFLRLDTDWYESQGRGRVLRRRTHLPPPHRLHGPHRRQAGGACGAGELTAAQRRAITPTSNRLTQMRAPRATTAAT